MTTEPSDRPATPATHRGSPGGRRRHAATGGRILVAGIGSAATLALTALMAGAEPAPASPPAVPAVVQPLATAAPPTSTAPPVRQVIRVVVRRHAGAQAAVPSATPRSAPAPTRVAPAPAPAPRPAAAAPVTRSRSS